MTGVDIELSLYIEQCQNDAIIGTINNVERASMGRQDRFKGEYFTGK